MKPVPQASWSGCPGNTLSIILNYTAENEKYNQQFECGRFEFLRGTPELGDIERDDERAGSSSREERTVGTRGWSRPLGLRKRLRQKWLQPLRLGFVSEPQRLIISRARKN